MTPKHFRLLDLPAEIFLAILELVLVRPGPICLHPAATAVKWQPIGRTLESKASTPSADLQWRRQILPPPIARTNRLLRHESLRLFYSINMFHGLNWTDPRPQEWLALIPAEVKGEFRTCFLLTSTWSAADLVAFLKRMFEAKVEIREVDADEAVVEKLRNCSDVKDGRVFEVRFL